MLNIKNLSKTIHNKKILDEFSLTVDNGSIAMLLGSSGVGKSTLLRVLNNLESVDSGEIYLDGKAYDPAQLRKDHLVGMVFQYFNLIKHLTVEQNIMLGLEKVCGKSTEQAHQKAYELLKEYGLEDKAHQYGFQISGGQKQRLAIAREVALERQIICLDEPTSALDPALTAHVASMISKLANEGYSVIVATHDTTLLGKLPCTIHLMQDGKIVQGTSSDEFFKQPEQFPLLNQFVRGNHE